MKSMNGEFAQHLAFVIKIDIVEMRRRDEFQEQSIRICDSKNGVAKSCADFLAKDVMFFETRFPIIERRSWDCEAGCNDLPGAARATTGARPGKKGDDRSGPSGSIPEVKMVSRWIVEVDGALDETKPEHAGVKIQIRLRIGRDRGDMMDAEELH